MIDSRSPRQDNSSNNNLAAQLSRLKKEPPDDKIGLSTEGMRVLVHREAVARMEAGGGNLNCHVIEAADFNRYLGQMKSLFTDTNSDVRMQLIVKNDRHYTAMDFKFSPEGNQCIVLDAAGDLRMQKYVLECLNATKTDGSNLFEKVYLPQPKAGKTSTGNIQKDFFSCPMFALDHVNQVSLIPDVYEQLNAVAKSNGNASNLPIVNWGDLPPQLIWNAQSTAILNDYAASHPDKIHQVIPKAGVSFDQYVRAGLKEVEVLDKKQNIMVRKAVNTSTERIFEARSAEARNYLSNKTPDQINEITSGVSAANITSVVTLPIKIRQYMATARGGEMPERHAAVAQLKAMSNLVTNDNVKSVEQSFDALKKLDQVSERLKPVSTAYHSKTDDAVKQGFASQISQAVNSAYSEVCGNAAQNIQANPTGCVEKLQNTVSDISVQAKQYHAEKHPVRQAVGALKSTSFEAEVNQDSNHTPTTFRK